MVDALTRIHAALVPGGLLVDTQPVSLRLPVTLGGEPIGDLENEEWLETVATVDAEIDEAVAGGLFELRHEERYRVVHAFGSGSECLDEVSAWAGTAVPDDIAARLAQGAGTATVEHDVRLRLLGAS